jgi:hypothetical protein
MSCPTLPDAPYSVCSGHGQYSVLSVHLPHITVCIQCIYYITICYLIQCSTQLVANLSSVHSAAQHRNRQLHLARCFIYAMLQQEQCNSLHCAAVFACHCIVYTIHCIGRCVSMRELAATALTTKLDPAAKLYGSSATALASSAWDADMIHSCLCDTMPYFDGANKGATDCFTNFSCVVLC